jgi:hypothetical protein
VRRWLICAGTDGSDKALRLLEQAVETRRPDGVLFLGGILCPTEEQQAKALGKKDLTSEEARLYGGFFETLDKIDVFTALIPGDYDAPLREFLRLEMGAEIQNPKIHLVHATLATGSDFVISVA